MLKITTPFRQTEEVLGLIDAGADELYCGYLPPEWSKKYTALEFERKGGRSNFTDLTQLKKAVGLAHKRNIPVYLAINGLYVRRQYPLLLKTLKQLEQINLDGYIVADIGLLLRLKEMKCTKKIHISTGGTAFNSEAVKFYKELGASRIILDRQITLEAMKILSQEPGIEFEVFMLNTFCTYIDGFCTFMHTYNNRESVEDICERGWGRKKLQVSTVYGIERADACCLKYSVEAFDSLLNKKIKIKKISPTFFKQLVDGMECGVCAIYDIMNTNINSLKIVGRQLTPEVRLKSTKFIRAVLDILINNKGINKLDFMQKAKWLYQKTFEYKKRCRGNNCYHPELLNLGK